MNTFEHVTTASTLDRLNFAITEALAIVKRLGPITIHEYRPNSITDTPAYKALSPQVAETVMGAYNRLNIHHLAARNLDGVGLPMTQHEDYTYSVALTQTALLDARKAMVKRHKELDRATQEAWKAA